MVDCVVVSFKRDKIKLGGVDSGTCIIFSLVDTALIDDDTGRENVDCNMTSDGC